MHKPKRVHLNTGKAHVVFCLGLVKLAIPSTAASGGQEGVLQAGDGVQALRDRVLCCILALWQRQLRS